MDDRPHEDKQIKAGPSLTSDDKQSAVEHRSMEPRTSFQFQGSVKDSIVGAGVVDSRSYHYHLTNVNYSGNEPHSSGTYDKPENAESLCEELKHMVEKRAKEISGKLTLPIKLDLAIKYEQLELKCGVQRSFPELDDEGHYQRREDFGNLLMRPCKGDISIETMFDQALQFAKEEAKVQTSNEESHAKHISRHGNVVAVVGQAGIGKTTLAKKLVELISKGKIFPNNEYTFFIPFREVEFMAECSLFDFILTGCNLNSPSKFHHMANAWIEKLQNNPNVVFIFDGLDEANTDLLSKRNYRVSHRTTSKPDDFVRKLLTGDIFPLAKKFVTSRPRQFFELDPGCRPHFAVDILGLNKMSQIKLGKQICHDNFEKVQEFLHDHPDVSFALYVPVKCIIVLAILSTAASKECKATVRSLTDIFVQALDHFLRSVHTREGANEVGKFAKLAWKGFLDRKIIFSKADVDNAEISKDALQAFLLTFTERNLCFSILDGDKRIAFTHLIWQELFAAVNAIFLLPLDEFKTHLYKLTSPLWEVVSKFMFGLCHPIVRKKIDSIMDPGLVKELDLKKKKLYDLAVELMKQISAEKVNRRKPLFPLLQLCSWLQEVGDPLLDAAVAEHFPSMIELHRSLHSADVSSLIYVMNKVEKDVSLPSDIYYGVRFIQDSLQRFLKGLANLPHALKMLGLTKNKIDDEAAGHLAEVIIRIKILRLHRCSLGSHAMIAIFNKIACRPQPLESLELTDMKVDDDAAQSLAEAVAKIKILRLPSYCLNSSVVSKISKKIACLPHPMELFDLTSVQIDDETAIYLADAVANIKDLRLPFCQLSSYAVTKISRKIATLSQPMNRLDLGRKAIDDNAAASLADAVFNIKDLRLVFCKLSSQAVVWISKKIARFQQPMEMLDLHGNVMDDDAMTSLADAVANIKRLNLTGCELSNHATTGLLQKVARLGQPMEMLDLESNALNDDAAASVADAISNIKDLRLPFCQLSALAMTGISRKIARLSHPMELLDLTGNQINDDAARSLAGAVANIKSLKLCSCGLSGDATATISKQIARLSEPMEKFHLSGNAINDDAAASIADAVSKIKYFRVWGSQLNKIAKDKISKSCALHGCIFVD